MVFNIKKYLKLADKNYYNYFKKLKLDLSFYIFKFVFCLLLRELSIDLSIYILDFYILNNSFRDIEAKITFLLVALFLKMKEKIYAMHKDEISDYL